MLSNGSSLALHEYAAEQQGTTQSVKEFVYPKISIVTPSYNQAEYLEQCINSILSQNYPNLEYIIIDGGSDDGSLEIIRKYSAHLKYWQSKPDAGHYAAVNLGFTHATGEIMGYLNSDDMFHPGGLNVLAQVFSHRPEVEFLTGKRVGFNVTGDIMSFGYVAQRWSRKFFLNPELFDDPQLVMMQQATYWRRSLWERAGAAIDTNYQYSADYDLWARFLRHSQLYTVDERIAGFRLWGKTQRTLAEKDKRINECKAILQREEILFVAEDPQANEFPELISWPEINAPKALCRERKSLRPIIDIHSRCESSPLKISIVTANLNQGQFLEECVESVLSQSNCNVEYVIMDGGSVDESVEIIKKYDHHLHYWQSEKDAGHYAAVNEGFKHTNGEIMCWLNADDKLHQDTLQVVVEAFHTKPNVRWLSGVPSAWNEAGDLYWIFSRVPIYSRFDVVFRNFADVWVQQESIFWRRSLWEQAGGAIDTRWSLAGDLDLWRRFFRFEQLYSIGRILSGSRSHSNQRSSIYLRKYMSQANAIIQEEKMLLESGFYTQSYPPPIPIMI